jgi:hypothetical protein
MKRLLILVLLAALSVASVYAQTVSTSNETQPLPTAASPIIHFPAPTAANADLVTIPNASTAAVQVITLPAGTKGFWAIPTITAVNFGNASCTTGDNWPVIATGGVHLFIVSPLTPRPGIYFSHRSTAVATNTVRIVPFK